MRKKEKIEELTKRSENIPLDSAIYLEKLSFGYNDNHLNIKEINLDIKKGTSVAIIGHNGSGKSTLAKLVDGILIQDSGDIYIYGVKMNDDNALLLRKNISIVFQNPDSQFIGATVMDDIAFSLENQCIRNEDMMPIILDCLRKVGMEEYLNSEPYNLSGGQKQRVAIAGAIARKSSILILDEAGAMLDPKGKMEIRNIIKDFRKENPDLTVLNITHELDEAYDSDRVIVLNDGDIVLDGTPSYVFNHDDLLKSINLDIPFTHKLLHALNSKGLDIKNINSESELIEKLCQ